MGLPAPREVITPVTCYSMTTLLPSPHSHSNSHLYGTLEPAWLGLPGLSAHRPSILFNNSSGTSLLSNMLPLVVFDHVM